MLEAIDIVIGHGGQPISGSLYFSADGGCILLAGPNGSGKTTLLRTLAGLLPPVHGKVLADGLTCMVPTRIPKIKGFTLRQFITTGCYRSSSWSGRIGPVLSAAIDESMERLGLSHMASKDIATLSDGEFQKGCLASALSIGASVLLLDEPTAFLDVEGRSAVIRTLTDIAAQGVTVIFSSHEIAECAPLAGRIIGLDRRGGFHDSLQEEKNGVLASCFPDYFVSLKV